MRRRQLALLAAGAALLGACGGTSSHHFQAAPPLSITPRSSAAARLMAAAQAMTEAGSYRFTGSITVGTAATKVTGEFEAPDRVHEVITTPKGQTVEVLFAGGKNFVHDRASGRWAVGAAPSRSSPQSDPRVAFSVLQDATDVTPTPDGDGVRFSLQPDAAARIVTLPAQSGAIVVSGRAALTGGDLSNLELSIRAGAEELDVVLGYTEIGVGPSVTLPTI